MKLNPDYTENSPPPPPPQQKKKKKNEQDILTFIGTKKSFGHVFNERNTSNIFSCELNNTVNNILHYLYNVSDYLKPEIYQPKIYQKWRLPVEDSLFLMLSSDFTEKYLNGGLQTHSLSPWRHPQLSQSCFSHFFSLYFPFEQLFTAQ